jgi:multicomponent Na+:H+ antiporter subunit E
MILTRKEIMEPVLVHIHTDLKQESSKVMLANSITLTPGTITVSMTGSDLLVHCLDETLATGMEDSRLVSLLKKIEKLEENKWN